RGNIVVGRVTDFHRPNCAAISGIEGYYSSFIRPAIIDSIPGGGKQQRGSAFSGGKGRYFFGPVAGPGSIQHYGYFPVASCRIQAAQLLFIGRQYARGGICQQKGTCSWRLGIVEGKAGIYFP